MDEPEIFRLTRIMNNLEKAYAKLPDRCAAEAVNFFKERFVAQVDINNVPFAKRKPSWITRARDRSKNSGRAILVDSGRLKRDVHKVYANAQRALISTSRLTQPYAKALNEGFTGTVNQTVKAHERRRYGHEKRGTGVFSVKTKRERQKTIKVQTGTIQVRTFKRTIHQKIPPRRYMGNSLLLEKRLDFRILSDLSQAIVTANP